MTLLTQDRARTIIKDFAAAIRERKRPTAKPSKAVINFRDEKGQGIERPIEIVPTDLLRYRKDNGRIASDVMNYERENGPLDECQLEAQEQLFRFLELKDAEKTDILFKSVEHSGQNEPAIVTCDGFLINGNRRKMVFEKLRKARPGDERFESMKVVILPGEGDPGGPPTLLEIERIENRYQLQSEGKSEYYGFDRALSIKRKVDVGFSLEEQLRDDPRFASATSKELERAVKDYQKEYLWPLECVDRYLHQFNRDGMYGAVSTGQSDKEGRWQAFIDYSKAYHVSLAQKKWQLEHEMPDDAIGAIEEAAFNVIRVRSLVGLPKVHQIMRSLPRYCEDRAARKEILHIADEVDPTVPAEECVDKDGTPLSLQAIDAKWAEVARERVIHRLRKAIDIVDRAEIKETPLSLLEAALKKLTHPNMQIDRIDVAEITRARQLVNGVRDRAHELEQKLYHNEKQWKAIPRKR